MAAAHARRSLTRALAGQVEMINSIEFHDSTISSVEHNGEAARLTLDAYVHRWERVNESWKGTGWGQRVEILVLGAAKLTSPDLP